jgi:hypothetical protein
MSDERSHAVTWHHVFFHARAGLIVFLIAAVALIVPSQMKDLLADLADFNGGDLALAVAFHVALILMAFFLWYWTRTVLLAAFRIPDTRGARDALAAQAADGAATVHVFDWLPRVLFLGCAAIAAIAAARSEKYLNAAIAAAWGLALCWVLTNRLVWYGKGQTRLPPERARARGWLCRLWRRLLDLIDCGPFARWLAAALLIFATGLFALSAALAFVPGAIGYMTFPARWFPGASAALLLFGLSVGPLTALTYVFNRIEARIGLFGVTLNWRHFPVLLVLLALILLGPLKMNLHALRVVDDPSAMKPAARVLLADYFKHWVQTCAPGNGPVRPVLVSVSGGASRAGLWAARVLTMVDQDLAKSPDSSIFSVSSVSGGSLGTAAYLAMRAGAANSNGKPVCRLADLPAQAEAAREQALVEALRADAIGPALAGTLLGDAPRALMGVVAAPLSYLHNKLSPSAPWVFRGNDRAEALERAFEENWQQHGIDAMQSAAKPFGLDVPYLSLFYKKGVLRDYVPAWIANGTDQQKGDRIVTAPFIVNHEEFCTKDGRWYAKDTNCEAHRTFFWYRFGPFLSALDAIALLKADIPASTAVDNTSRFPFLSPSGELTPARATLAKHSAQIIDGGYFENEGLATSLEIARWLETYGPALVGRPVYPILVQATADADISAPVAGSTPTAAEQNAERHITRCGNARPENPAVGRGQPRSMQLLVPVLGLSAVRGGHTHVALKEAQQEFCSLAGHQAFFNFYLYKAETFDVPLNWVLSERVGKFIWSRADGALSACWNRAEEANLKETFAAAPADWSPGLRRKSVYACRQGEVKPVPIPNLPPPMTGP